MMHECSVTIINAQMPYIVICIQYVINIAALKAYDARMQYYVSNIAA